MTSQATSILQNSAEYLENETSYWEAKNTLSVYFDTMFEWDQD